MHIFIGIIEKSPSIKKVGFNSAAKEENKFLSVNGPSRPSFDSGANPMSDNLMVRELGSVLSQDFNFRDMTEDEIGI